MRREKLTGPSKKEINWQKVLGIALIAVGVTHLASMIVVGNVLGVGLGCLAVDTGLAFGGAILIATSKS